MSDLEVVAEVAALVSRGRLNEVTAHLKYLVL